MSANKLLFLLTLIFVAAQPTTAQSQPAQSQSQILRIISNTVIWQKDFPSILKLLNDWKNAGEARVVVYADQAEGTQKFSIASGDALRKAAELNLLIKNSKSELKPEVKDMLSRAWNTEVSTLAPVAQPVREEPLAAVVLTAKTNVPAQLLSTGLTLTKLKEAIGEPESISSVAIDTGDERRPVVLKLYHYAGGSIMFAIPDLSRTPGIIDRAFLNTQKISENIFRQ